jgi:hypothetical protein
VLRVCAESWVGFWDVDIFGCPYTRIAEAPFPAPAANSSTRLLPESATNKSPFGPIAKPAGVFREDELTAAESEVVKLNCPMTALGVMRPECDTGRGYANTRLLAESATYNVPLV